MNEYEIKLSSALITKISSNREGGWRITIDTHAQDDPMIRLLMAIKDYPFTVRLNSEDYDVAT